MRKQKPAKPYRDFPLTAHPNKQWCKKIRGKLHYFGSWDDPDAALALYLDQRDDLHAGRVPRTQRDGLTLGYVLDHFLSAKQLAFQADEIGSRSFVEYERTCERIAACLGTSRLVEDIEVSDLQRLRLALSTGKRGPLGPGTIRGELTRARMLFLYLNENFRQAAPYRKALKSPSRKQMRQRANEVGPRMFEAAEIRLLVKAAGPQLRAMILLGINCAFGNNDCGTLPIERLDLANGWHNYWRPKTHNPRRAALWPETVEALREVIGDRTDGLVFLTREGNCWSKEKGDNAISGQFRNLLKSLGMYRKNVTTFYGLRRTFETIGQTAGDQVAVDYAMGHIAPTSDMAAVYRQKTFDSQLLKVTNHLRSWYRGDMRIE